MKMKKKKMQIQMIIQIINSTNKQHRMLKPQNK